MPRGFTEDRKKYVDEGVESEKCVFPNEENHMLYHTVSLFTELIYEKLFKDYRGNIISLHIQRITFVRKTYISPRTDDCKASDIPKRDLAKTTIHTFR